MENLPSLVVILAFTVLALVLGLRMASAMLGNLRRGQRLRQDMEDELRKLRMYKALEHLGVDPQAYLHRVPLVDVQTQMKRCSQCSELERCDRCLARALPPCQFEFCPNREAILSAAD